MVIVCDDLGFAHLGSYGSDLLTPNLDRLAARGLRFTNFHTTAVCSPTRACLLTGRNHHRVGMGMLPDLPTNFPAYSGRIPRSAGTLAQILRADGYATFCVGKWHLVPRDQRVTGPYDMWPTGLGFDRYYGFLNGETNQWTPNLVRDTNHVEPPREPADGYHLDADLADNAIAYLRELRISHPQRPFLLWYASAAPHAPHQAPPEWIDRFRGQFDDGWDAWRDATLARQIDLGIVPEGTRLSSRPPWIEEWSTIDAPRRRLYARMMEVCAAFIAHADHHIGRVLDHLAATGDLDNTVVVFVSDNGASGEGGPNGTYNQLGHYISDEPDDIADELAHLDDLGGFRSSGHYPWGWALAGNTPFRRWKRYTFEGGVRDPFILAGPGIADPGGIRDQYCHATDVLPTVLDLCGIPLPDELDGVEQMSFDGVSLGPVLTDATAPEVHTSQYYECWGSRAMYHDGWKAVTDHVNQLTAAERDQIAGSHDFATDTWALFDTRNDPTESHDLAAEEPERLADLVARWYAAAERESGVPARRRRREPHHAHARPVDRRPDELQIPPRRQGPRGRRAEHRRRLPYGRNLRRATRRPRLPQCCANKATGSPAGPGTSPTATVRWCIAGKGGAHTVSAPVPSNTRVLVAQGELVDGQLEVALAADGIEIARKNLGVHPPLAWAPDGAFLTIGYARPFPVSDEYTPPAAAPRLTRRHHHPGRTTPALRPRRRTRTNPAPPIEPHSMHRS